MKFGIVWTLFIAMNLQAQILLHFILVIRTYILQKFHSMHINLNEIVLWEVYKNCFVFLILENLSRPFSVFFRSHTGKEYAHRVQASNK